MSLRSVARTTLTPPGGRYELKLVLGRRTTRALFGGPNALVAQWSQGGVDVTIELFAAGEASDEAIEAGLRAAVGIAGLDDDPTGFAAAVEQHPTLARLHHRYGGTRLGRTATVFESFARAVIEQLVTYEEASASIRRLIYRYGARVPGTDLVAFPDAATVAAIPPHDLRAMGVGIRRAVTLREGAGRGAAIERIRTRAPEDAIERLTSLRRVGVWTATKVAIEALGYPDAILLRDAVLPYAITKALTGTAGGDDALVACLEPFRPYRARVVRLIQLAQLYEHAVPGLTRRPPPIVDPHRRRPWRG